jgi:protein SCO1/2
MFQRFCILGLLLLGVFLSACNPNSTVSLPVGLSVDPPKTITTGKPFTDQFGNSVLLSDFRSKVVLLFFGYTNCPDVCPATVSSFSQIKNVLGPDAAQVAFVFITVDPNRDTPETLRRYMGAFDSSFVGLTTDLPTLTALNKTFNAAFSPPDDKGLVIHGNRTYLLDRNGLWRVSYPIGTSVKDLASEIRYWLGKP